MSQSEDEVKPDLERLKNIFDAANAGVEYAVPYKRVIACVTKTYAILFTPRSGSTWFSQAIAAHTMLSHPDEYFNVLTLKESLRHNKARDIYSYYDVVANKVTSPAGVFGFQISFFDLEIIEREAGLLSLVTGEKFFFVLMRKNFVAQAISMYLATLTGVFHVTDVNHINKIDHSSITIVYEEIKKWILHILAQEYGINQWVARKNISVTRFWYEDISLDVEKSIQVIADTLNCALPAYRKIEINKNVKLRDGRSDRIESIFRNKYTEFCNYWEVARGQEPCA